MFEVMSGPKTVPIKGRPTNKPLRRTTHALLHLYREGYGEEPTSTERGPAVRMATAFFADLAGEWTWVAADQRTTLDQWALVRWQNLASVPDTEWTWTTAEPWERKPPFNSALACRFRVAAPTTSASVRDALRSALRETTFPFAAEQWVYVEGYFRRDMGGEILPDHPQFFRLIPSAGTARDPVDE